MGEEGTEVVAKGEEGVALAEQTSAAEVPLAEQTSAAEVALAEQAEEEAEEVRRTTAAAAVAVANTLKCNCNHSWCPDCSGDGDDSTMGGSGSTYNLQNKDI